MSQNTQQNPKIKILIAYHKPAVLLKDEILTPIHLGRALATQESKDGKISKEDYEWMCENMIGDDTGENISHLNRYLNELTGIYWAWKNYDKLDNPDFIGFMHYRRVFDFSEDEKSKTLSEYPKFKLPSLDILLKEDKQNFLNLKDIINSLSHTHFITPKKALDTNPYAHYKALDYEGLYLDDLDALLSEIKLKFPDFESAAKTYMQGNFSYFLNMFILSKKDFFDYCHFTFTLLFSLQKKIDLSHRSVQASRALAFLGEWILGIYFTYLHQKNLKSKELPVIYIKHTDILIKELECKDKEAITIAFATDNQYALYLNVTLQSLLDNADKNKNYILYILYFDLDKELKNKLKTFQNNQISIYFIDIHAYLIHFNFDISSFFESDHIKKETYLRIFIPEIFKNYEKVLYLDTDLIIQADISTLYEEDISSHLLAAIKDSVLHCFYYSPYQFKIANKKVNYKYYLEHILKLKSPLKYFNGGVLLFNIKACLKIDFIQKASHILKEIPNLKYHDQDILNMLCNENFKELKDTFNVMLNIEYYETLSNIAEASYLAQYKYNLQNAKILHFAGGYKPWAHPHLAKAPIWWSYARKTPFYEEILFNNLRTYPTLWGAQERIKNQLSYKIGAEILSLKKNPLKIFILPLTLPFLIWQHKKDRKLYASITRVNQGLKLPLLEHYGDYTEGLKVKEHLSYRLGQALLKNPLTFVFKVKGIYKKWRKDKKFENA